MRSLVRIHSRALTCVQNNIESDDVSCVRQPMRARPCSNTRASTRSCPAATNVVGDLVMLARNKLEVIVVLVLAIILLALLCPRTPTIAILPERFWHSFDLPMHEEFVR